jgi:hypothetical protein
MNEEVSEGEISVQGIQQLLLAEYNLKLIGNSGQCSLSIAEDIGTTALN